MTETVQPASMPNPVGRPTKYDQVFCDRVEEEMGKGFSLTAFAGILGVARSTINEWMSANPEFSEAVNRGKAKRLVHWETAAMKVAERGGGPGTATVIVFGLKNMGGDEWADRNETRVTGKGGGPVQVQHIDLSKMTDEQLAALEPVIAALAATGGASSADPGGEGQAQG